MCTPLSSTSSELSGRGECTYKCCHNLDSDDILSDLLRFAARAEFVQHGIAPFVTVKHADACAEGFQLDYVADAGMFEDCTC